MLQPTTVFAAKDIYSKFHGRISGIQVDRVAFIIARKMNSFLSLDLEQPSLKRELRDHRQLICSQLCFFLSFMYEQINQMWV